MKRTLSAVWVGVLVALFPVVIVAATFSSGYLRDSVGNLIICGSCHTTDSGGLPRNSTGALAVTFTGPSPMPTTSLPPSEPPIYNGCQIFTASDPVWNASLGASPAVDPSSSSYIAAFLTALIGPNEILANHATNYWFVNYATVATFTGPMYFNTTNINNISNFSFDPSFQWEAQGATGATDHHLMVVNSSTCVLSEGYTSVDESVTGPSFFLSPTPSPTQVNQLRANSALVYTLAAPFPTPIPTPPSVSGGSTQLFGPVMPGTVRWEDYINNTPHAIGILVPNGSMQHNTFVYPANEALGTTFRGTGTPPPLGARMWLPPGSVVPACVNASPSTCPETRFVIECLENNGAYLVDQVASSGAAMTIRFANLYSGGSWSDPWSSADLNNLNSITINEFQFLVPPYGSTSIANCLGLYNPNGC